MKTYSFIFARGGSKGLPKKNILKLNGHPLVAHSILIAQKINTIEKVFVSTDDPEIASISKEYNAEVINRPKELADDHSSEWLAWQHAISWVYENVGYFDRFISIPATSPLREEKDIYRCLEKLQPGIDLVLTMTPSRRNPFFNMVKKDKENLISLVNNDSIFHRRQDAPQVYDLCTVAYVSRPSHILKSKGLWDGKLTAIEITPESSIDIDNSFDFELARLILESKSN